MQYDLKVSAGGRSGVPAKLVNSQNWWEALRAAENAFSQGYAAKARDIALIRAGAGFGDLSWNDFITPVGEELRLVRPDGKTVYINIHGRG